METLVQAIVIGIVQGLTEFLPISSSAHLIVVPRLLGWDDPFLNSAEFDVMLHIGTLAALLVYFWRDVIRLAAAFFLVAVFFIYRSFYGMRIVEAAEVHAAEGVPAIAGK